LCLGSRMRPLRRSKPTDFATRPQACSACLACRQGQLETLPRRCSSGTLLSRTLACQLTGRTWFTFHANSGHGGPILVHVLLARTSHPLLFRGLAVAFRPLAVRSGTEHSYGRCVNITDPGAFRRSFIASWIWLCVGAARALSSDHAFGFSFIDWKNTVPRQIRCWPAFMPFWAKRREIGCGCRMRRTAFGPGLRIPSEEVRPLLHNWVPASAVCETLRVGR
jgi:hypothetical protein